MSRIINNQHCRRRMKRLESEFKEKIDLRFNDFADCFHRFKFWIIVNQWWYGIDKFWYLLVIAIIQRFVFSVFRKIGCLESDFYVAQHWILLCLFWGRLRQRCGCSESIRVSFRHGNLQNGNRLPGGIIHFIRRNQKKIVIHDERFPMEDESWWIWRQRKCQQNDQLQKDGLYYFSH